MSTTTVIGQRFELRQRIFSEGNQAAYVALDRARAEEVLVLLVPTQAKLSSEAEQLLGSEIERAFSVAAPSLLPVWELVSTDDHRFLVMPRPQGTNAWEQITQRDVVRRLAVEDVCTVADDLILAARAAHAVGTRMGCSPRQVWVEPGRGAQVQYAWVGRTRSGAARGEAGTSVLESQGVEGAYFRAPEWNDDYEGPNAPVDQYFIAAMLYGLLTGEVPGGRLAPVRGARKDVPPLLAKAIEKGLAQDPGARHNSLDAFRDALHRRRPRLGLLVPIALVLVGLWVAFAVFQAGVGPASWALEAQRLKEQVATARAVPDPVPAPQPGPEARTRFAGRYADESGFDLHLGAGGDYLLDDTASVPVRRERGLWSADTADAQAVVLTPISPEATSAPAWRARATDGHLDASPPNRAGTALRLRKIEWPSDGALPSQPLLRWEQPRAGSVLQQRQIEVSGQVGVARTEVTVNGSRVPVVGMRFTHVVDAAGAGAVELKVEAVAPDGFAAELTRQVQVDEAAPQALITQAELQSIEGVWHLTVAGRVTDDVAVESAQLNGEPLELGADGAFRSVRQGAEALSRALVEVVATDTAGRRARQLRWPVVLGVKLQSQEGAVASAREALVAGRTEEAERLLRALRSAGGLIEQVPPEEFGRLVRGTRLPILQLDEVPAPPQHFNHDGSREIVLRGSVEWFGPNDALLVGGQRADVRDGRFEARVALPDIGRQVVPVSVTRDNAEVARRDVTVLLADAPTTFQTWTGAPPTPAQLQASAEHGLPLTRENSLGMRFVLVPPGAFLRKTSDGRTFEVRLSRPYYVQTTEVSREHFARHGGRPGATSYATRSGKAIPLSGTQRPALELTREEARAFAARLSVAEKGTYRLPSEAEWEWAARAGDGAGNRYWSDDLKGLAEWANFADRSIRTIVAAWPEDKLESRVDDRHPGPWETGTGRANAFGLRDMLGNVAEWVADGYAEYDVDAVTDPVAAADRRDAIHRGGGWMQRPAEGDFSVRGRARPETKEPWLGFRLVLEAGAP